MSARVAPRRRREPAVHCWFDTAQNTFVAGGVTSTRSLQLTVILSAALVFVAAGRAAPNPRYTGTLNIREWTTEETGGLAQSFSIVQHPATGLIYVGNEAGVLEFDGVRWRRLPPPDNSDPVVRGLAWDGEGRLWGASANFLSIYEVDARGVWRGEALRPAEGADNAKWGVVWDLRFHRGFIWGNTAAGILRVDPRSRAWRLWPLGQAVTHLGEVDGELWFHREGHPPMRTRGDEVEEVVLPRLPDGLWLLGAVRTADGVLQLEHSRGVLELRGGRWVPLGDEMGKIFVAGSGASRVRRFTDGRRVFSTRARTLVFADAAGRVLGSIAEPPGITFGVTPSTFIDREGGLWMANASGIRRAQVEGSVVRHGPAQGLRGAGRKLAFDGEDLLVASAQGLFIRRASTGEFTFQPEMPSDGQALWPSPAGGWLMAAGQRFAEWRDGRVLQFAGMPTDGVSLLSDPRDPERVFVGKLHGLSVWRRSKDGWTEERNFPPTASALYALAMDRSGRMWASSNSSHHDVWRVTPGREGWKSAVIERVDGSSAGVPTTSWQLATVDGDVVIHGPKGIWRVERGGERVVRDERFAALPQGASTPVLGVAGGFRRGVVYVVGAGEWRDRIWRGVRAAEEDAWRFEELAVPEARGQLNYLSMGESPDERTLWIASINGALSVDRMAPPLEFSVPAALWRGVRTLGAEPLNFGGAARPGRIEIPAGHRAVRLEFAAPVFRPTLSGRTGLEYRTRAAGVDDDWTAWSASAERELTNLPPGVVRVEVQARNHLGMEGPVAAMQLTVPPFWWETWWARTLVLAAGALAVAVAVRWVVRRQFQQRIALLEAQAAVQQERLRIARDMHDDLGSTLASIAHLSDRRATSPRPADEALGRIHEATRDLVQRTRDIVWAATPEHDSLESLIEQFAGHAERTLGDRGIAVKVELPREVPQEALGSGARHDAFLAFKEAVNNAAKYSQARTATLRVELTARELVVTLADDGVGFAPGELQGSGNGLRNLRARLAPHGGSGEVESAPGQGTTVTLRLPRTRA